MTVFFNGPKCLSGSIGLSFGADAIKGIRFRGPLRVFTVRRQQEYPHHDSAESDGGGSGAARMSWARRLKRL